MRLSRRGTNFSRLGDDGFCGKNLNWDVWMLPESGSTYAPVWDVSRLLTVRPSSFGRRQLGTCPGPAYPNLRCVWAAQTSTVRIRWAPPVPPMLFRGWSTGLKAAAFSEMAVYCQSADVADLPPYIFGAPIHLADLARWGPLVGSQGPECVAFSLL
jgi:hypothetical protein